MPAGSPAPAPNHSTRSVSYCTGLSLRQPPSGAPHNVTWESEITYTSASRLPPTRRHLTRQKTARGGSSRHHRASTAQNIVSTSRGVCQKVLQWKLLAGVPLRARKRLSWRHKLLILQFGVTYRERVRGIRLNHPPLGMGDSKHTLREHQAHVGRDAGTRKCEGKPASGTTPGAQDLAGTPRLHPIRAGPSNYFQPLVL